MSTTDTPQEPGWLKIQRQKAKLYDKVVPELQADLAILRSDIDEAAPTFSLWKADYANRVQAGETSWADPEAVKADAERFGLVRPAIPDFAADRATQARIEAMSAEAVEVDPKDSARNRMAQARNMDEFIASYRAQGGVTIED